MLGKPPPSVEALVIATAPFDARGYAVSETIGIQITFSEAVEVSGTPLLKLDIGEALVDAALDEEATDGAVVAFHHVVTLEDRDEDGISIGADALEVRDGAIRNASGIDADLDIGEHVIAGAADHLVLGAPPPQECGDQRSVALRRDRQWRRRGLVQQWAGTPFRVDMIRNFPEFVSDADLWGLLEPIGRLADQIEEQLGYRIVEMGELIEPPARARPGWDQHWERYWREQRLVADPGQVLVFYLNDYGTGWGASGSSMSAHNCCRTVSYNKRALGPMWTGEDPCCQGDANQYTRKAETIVHEVFHLLGFTHAYNQPDRIGVPMSAGALDVPWDRGSLSFYATWTDIENLRCIFPKGG